MITLAADVFVLFLTIMQPGTGRVTMTSEYPTIAACHVALTEKITAAGDRLVSAHCEGKSR